jgi:hypothetical protein
MTAVALMHENLAAATSSAASDCKCVPGASFLDHTVIGRSPEVVTTWSHPSELMT